MANAIEKLDFEPTPKQAALLHDISGRAVGRALQKGETQALSLWERVRSLSIPSLVIQQAIFDTATEWSVDVQTYWRAVNEGPKSQKYGYLMIRLVDEMDDFGRERLQEGQLLGNHLGYAVDVYPPQE